MKSSLLALGLLFLFLISFNNAWARSLKGGVSQEELHYELDLKKQSPKTHEQAAGLTREGSVVKQPLWIEGKVFTHKDMHMYSYFEIFPLKKKFVWKVPTNKKSKMTFSKTIMKHWKGYMPKSPGKVICEPIEKKERFKFHHKNPEGPSGFFERIGKTKKGYPLYRIWFNEK